MNSPFPPTYATTANPLPHNLPDRSWSPTVSWSAILAGASAALALQVLFMMLGAGLGFAIYSPLTDLNPIADLGRGAVIVQGISAVVSLWFGGWVAGRFTPLRAHATGWLHGFSVWCLATVAGVLFVSVGADWALGDLSKMVGGGLALAGRPAAAVASGATGGANDALKQSGDTLASFADEALGGRPAGGSQNLSVRAKREVSLAVARLFSPLPDANVTANRAAVAKALTDHAGMDAATAEQTIKDWTATYDGLKADWAAAKNAAEAKARQVADEAAATLAVFSLCAFFGFVLGALAAGWGGKSGATCARNYESRAES